MMRRDSEVDFISNLNLPSMIPDWIGKGKENEFNMIQNLAPGRSPTQPRRASRLPAWCTTMM
jgi:hypothetical protein